MFRKFLGDTAIYGVSNVIGRGIVGLLLLPVYARRLTPGQYGTVDLLQVVRSLAVLLVVLEVNQGLVRLLPEAQGSDRRKLSSSALWFSVAMYGAFAFVGLVWARPLSALLLGTEAGASAFRLAMAYIASDGLFALFQLQLRFDLRPKAYAIASISSLLVTALVSVVLLTQTPYRVGAVLTGLIAGNVAGGAISFGASWRQFGFIFDRRSLALMLGFSAPLVFASVSGFVANFIDRIAIRHFLGVPDVGVFAVGARIASVSSFVMFGIQMALTPLVYTHYLEADTPAAIARILRVVLAVLLSIFVVMGTFAPELVERLAAPAFLPAARVVPLVAASAFLGQFWMFAPGLGIAKRTRIIALLNTLAALVNTALNFLLVPAWGIIGAASATLVGSLLLAVGYVLLGHRYYSIPHAWRRIGVAALITTFAVVGAIVAWHAQPAESARILLAKLSICLLACVLVVSVLIRRSELRSLKAMFAARQAIPSTS